MRSRLIPASVLILSLVITLVIFKPLTINASNGGLMFRTGYGTFFIPASSPTRVKNFPANDSHLEKIVKDNIGDSQATYGVVINNYTTGQTYTFNQNETFMTASLYKLMVMATLYDMESRNQLTITPEMGNSIERMITVSSNEDAISLAEMIGWDKIEQTMRRLGLSETSLGSPPMSDPSDINKLLTLIYEGRIGGKERGEEMISIMSNQKINDRIPLLLPDNTYIAHKTGELDDVRHDAGVVKTDRNVYSMVLMSKNIPTEVEVKGVMAKISKDIYDYFQRQWDSVGSIL